MVSFATKTDIMKKVIAIDGPAAAGKSTIAKKIARELGYIYIDTGAMYRAVALRCIRNRVPFSDEIGCSGEAERCQINLKTVNGIFLVYLDGENISDAIRTPEVSQGASKVSAVFGVREVLVEKQQAMAAAGKVIMEGRDIGTVVLPKADCKIFLTATLSCRARRRYLELCEKGEKVSLANITKEMAERDHRDCHRLYSPLRQAEDAVYMDTTEQNIEEVYQQVLNLIIGER